MNKRVAGWGGALIIALAVISPLLRVQHAEAVACSSSGAAQNGITVSPSHGNAFYVDTGVIPKLDAGYIGYRVTNSTGSTQSSLWTEVSGFSGGVLSLADASDSMMQLPILTNSSTGTVYFMLKATGATSTAQSHTLKVYDKRPDLSGASVLYSCTFTFSKVQETIKAAANKLANNGLTSSAAIEVSDTSPELGQLVNITVEGQTGQIGHGSTPDNDIIWLTPAAISSWPTRALRLEDVSVTFDGNGNWSSTADQVTYNDLLLISGADGLTNVDNSEYRATFSFRVIGRPASSVQAIPIAQIASGTQIKHSDTTATGASVTLSFSSLAINASLTKSVTSTTGLTTVTCGASCTVPGGTNGQTYVAVPYRLTAQTTTSTNTIIDDIVDTPANGIIFKPSSATITDIGRSAVAIPDPVYLASESGLSPRPYHFVGPFTFSSGTSATLNYQMWVPVGSYANTSYAMIGDQLIGATASAKSRITVTSTGTSSVSAVADTVGFSVLAVTDAATGVTASAATINGTVDPNGASPLTAQFEYGTNSNLTGATTVTATTPASGTLSGLTEPTIVSYSLSGLSSSTTYYYRVIAGSASGSIESFTTAAVLAPPTVTTSAASSVTTTTAAVNGSINPNLTSITGIQFIYGTNASLSSGNTTSTIDDGSGTAALTIAGGSTQDFTKDLSGLSAGTTYYFKIRACTSALTGTYPNVTCASFVDGSILSFVAASAPTVTTSAATSVTTTTATLNGTINPNGASTTATFVYGTDSSLNSGTSTVTVGTLTGTAGQSITTGLTGLSSSTTYYFKAVGENSSGTTSGSILSFTTEAATGLSRTLTIDGSSYTGSYAITDAEPTLTSTPSVGAGTKTYSSLTPSVCTINSSSGAVTFATIGTCTLGATIATDGTYIEAAAESISFSIDPLAPVPTTLDATSVSVSVATLNGTVNPGGDTTTVWFVYGTDPTLSSGTTTVELDSVDGLDDVAVTTDLTDLSPSTTYYFQVAAENSASSVMGEILSFVTDDVGILSRTLTIDAESYTSTYIFTDAAPTLTATPSAGTGTMTFSGDTPEVCTIDEATGVVTFVTTGTCTLGAAIATDGEYAEATADTITFVIDPVPPEVPLATTEAASAITTTTATLNGIVNANRATTTVSFVYGTSPSLLSGTIEAFTDDVTGETDEPVSIAVTELSAGTTYYYYVSASNSEGSVTGEIVSFTTEDAGALERTFTIDESSYTTEYTFSEETPTLTSTPSAGTGLKTYVSFTPEVCSVGEESGTVTFIATGTCTLSAVIDTDGIYAEASADSISFTIIEDPAIPPTATTEAATDVTATTATLHGTMNAEGSDTSVTFLYGTTEDLAEETGAGTVVGTDDESVHADITGLLPETTYYFRVVGENVAGSDEGSILSFTTGTAGEVSRTLTLDEASYRVTYVLNATPPTLTSTPSAGTGTKSYTSSTPSICTVHATTGLVTFHNTGTCTLGATIDTDGTYTEAEAERISFLITPNSNDARPEPPSVATLTVNGGAACTPSRTILLGLSATNVTEVIIGDDVLFTDDIWTPFSSPENRRYTLPPTDGTYTIYVLLRNQTMHSSVVSATILLDQTDRCGTRTPPVSEPPQGEQTDNGGGGTDGSTDSGNTNNGTADGGAVAEGSSILSYDLYIVNPDGTERHMRDERFAKTDILGATADLIRFEDKGADMDYDDVVMLVDWTDWEHVIVTGMSIDAGWFHNVRMTVYSGDEALSDTLLWVNSHESTGQFSQFDATALRSTVTSPVGYINPKGVVPWTPATTSTRPRSLSVSLDDAQAIVEHPEVVCSLQAPLTRALIPGAFGVEVTRLQGILKCLGFFPATTDVSGFYGPVTLRAVTDYQRVNGLPPLGVVGPRTRAALNTFVQ